MDIGVGTYPANHRDRGFVHYRQQIPGHTADQYPAAAGGHVHGNHCGAHHIVRALADAGTKRRHRPTAFRHFCSPEFDDRVDDATRWRMPVRMRQHRPLASGTYRTGDLAVYRHQHHRIVDGLLLPAAGNMAAIGTDGLTMKTRVCRLYGQNDIRIETDDVAPPGPGQVLLRMAAGGICGSDLHYYQDGGFGPIRVREPIILGHEVAGTVEQVGSGVDTLRPGAKVAFNPSRPCGACPYCLAEAFRHCLNMRFSGSAMRMPHEQGGFREYMVVDAMQCEPVSDTTSLAEAACAEPLAVALHARNQAPDLTGKRVLVTGAGPIGCLCVAVARVAGAGEIVVTDLQDTTLAVARQMGADVTVNIIDHEDALEPYYADKGYFDVVFECSAAGPALATAARALRPAGTLVQVGVAGDVAVPINLLVGKEIVLRGSHRFDVEYQQAVRLIDSGRIDVKPIITA